MTIRKGRVPKPPKIPERVASIPLCWFEDELYQQMRSRVRPATALTRCRLLEVVQPLPLESFKAFMKPLNDGDAVGLVRDTDGEMTPTKTSSACDRYNYIITRPMVTDRLFQLDTTDQTKGPWPKKGKGAWRRGLGCSKLNLPAGVHKKGKLGESLSMVAGSCVVEFKVPKRWEAMPVLTMRFFSLTVNHLGQFVWPAKFSDASRALLKKLARIKIQKMLDDPEYPIHEGMRKALLDTTSRDSYLSLVGAKQDEPLRQGAPALLRQQ